ncbi:Ig-like domain-containing protein [Hyalangium minutum]|nr:Ig-like domain-containing protein [Hyalangium minutum]
MLRTFVSLMAAALVLVLGSCSPSSERSPGEATAHRQSSRLVAAGWEMPASLSSARSGHTTTLLPSGKVLVAGGDGSSGPQAHAELYDPVTNAWGSTGSLAQARKNHTATLLPSGKVLIVGGEGPNGALTSAELYDAATGSWATIGSLVEARGSHTATLLASGQVLVVGGVGASSALNSAELYDPVTGSWSVTGSLTQARSDATAALLASGQVLVTGGAGPNGALASAELYDPATSAWSATGALAQARSGATATLLPSGKVFVAGGVGPNGALARTELYDPVTGSWADAVSLAQARFHATATLLPSGRVLVAGGADSSGALTSAELYDPSSGYWASSVSLFQARALHTATLLPSGKVLVVGGTGTSGALASAELYNPAAGSGTSTLVPGSYNGKKAALLPSGKVLVLGGYGYYSINSKLYDPANGSWTDTGPFTPARDDYTMTLLPSGQVLVVGGRNDSGYTTSAKLYDPATHRWADTGSLAQARAYHTATLLPSGTVLIAGGVNNSGNLNSVELYDPVTGTWANTGSLAQARSKHAAALLPSGKVLVVCGQGASSSGYLSSAEVYDPGSGSWTVTGSLALPRFLATATLLPSGKVLVAGGYNGGTRVEVYDPATGSWTDIAPLRKDRFGNRATLLPSGKVLVVGGYSPSPEPIHEVYDPATGSWTDTASLSQGRSFAMVTLLPSGQVLVMGGDQDTVELYDDTGSNPLWRPGIVSVSASAPLIPGASFTVNGSLLRGISEASGGSSRSSASDFPFLTLLDIERGTLAVLPSQGFSSTHVTSTVPPTPPGQYLLSVTVNGLTSAKVIEIAAAPDTVPPTVTLTAPGEGATLRGIVTLTATALDNVAVTRVEFYDGATLLGTDTAAPFSFSWDARTAGNGAHSLTVKAYDAGGQSATSPGVNVTVDNDLIAPTVSISAPAAGAAVTGTLTVTAMATDDQGVARVELYEGSTLLATGTTSPYAYSWNTRTGPNGDRTLTAKAYDAGGNVATAQVTVTANNDFTPPTVTLTAPTEGATLSGTVLLTATASDTSGISQVEFFLGPILVGTDSTAPYSFSYNTRGRLNGAWSLTAKAYDTLNNVGTSAAVNVTLDNDYTPPTVMLTAPGQGATLTGTVVLTATASDPSGISRMDFFVGSTQVGSATTAPYSFSYDTRLLPNGAKTLTAKAYDTLFNLGTSATVNVTFDNDLTPPTVTLTAPRQGATVSGNLVFTATASDTSGISKVDFFVDTFQVGTATTAPYSFGYNTRNLPNGAKTLTAKAYDTLNNVGTSAAVSVTFNNDLTPPTATLTAPVEGATLKGTVTLSATATDNVAVTRVEFYDGATLLGTDTASPYSFSWATRTAGNGAHSLTVKAYDALGQSSTSPGVNVTVDNDLIAPTVSISAPVEGATVTGTLTVTATATDNLGVTRVDFYEGSTLLGTDTSSPYAYNWNTRAGANGDRTLTAKAYDAGGNVGTAEVRVNADNDFTPPTVTLTAPAEGAPLKGTVVFTATASDNLAVTRVLFFIGTTQVGSDTTAPYSFSYNTRLLPNGAKVLTATAYDAVNNMGTSAPVNVTFENDFTPPTVTLTAPAEGETLSGTAVLTATASDPAGIARVDFFVGTTAVGSDATAPYSFSYNTRLLPNGAKVLTAKAYDTLNNLGTSAPVNATFENDFTPPTVTLTAPAEGETLTGTVVFTATASDAAGISKVVYFAGTTQVGTATTAPYSFSYNTRLLVNGSKVLTAKAYDTLNNIGTSAPVNVIFDNDLTPPTTSITSPASGSTVTGVVQIDAIASDDRGTITKVEFYQGSLLLGSVTTAPYTWSWDTTKVSIGNTTLRSRAYDGAGNSVYSTAVTVTVTR